MWHLEEKQLTPKVFPRIFSSVIVIIFSLTMKQWINAYIWKDDEENTEKLQGGNIIFSAGFSN